MGRNDEPLDEEALLQEFGEGPNEPERADTGEGDSAVARVSDQVYAQQVQTILDHPRFLALGRDEQLLYLQLHRHCQGRGASRVRVSVADMCLWVGRRWNNVRRSLEKLVAKRLVTRHMAPKAFQKGQYAVHPLTAPVGGSVSALEMSNRIDQLTAVEHSMLTQQIATLSPGERRELRAQAAELMRELTAAGFTPLPSVESQAFRYLAYLKTTGIWRVARRFPDAVPADHRPL